MGFQHDSPDARITSRMISGPKRVLFLSFSLLGGGAERVFSILLRHLDRSKFEPHLGILYGKGAYFEDIPRDVTVHDLQTSRVRYALPRIVKLVRKLKPQTMMSTVLPVNVAAILSKPFFPPSTRVLVREAANPSAILSFDQVSHPYFWDWAYRHLYKRADGVICLSDAMANDMVHKLGIPANKTVRIYNPVEVQRVREMADVGGNPYSGAGPHLVAAGRLSQEKGFDVLIAAMPQVLKKFPGATLVILGEGQLKQQLIQQAQEVGLEQSVRLLGYQQNPWPYFRHADVFVLSSRFDGMPNAVLEALALGTRVVAADCPGGIREIQACDPEMILVPPEKPDALADGIISAINRRLGAQSCHRQQPDLAKFDLQQAVSEYSRLL